jgi:hypothetical protein
MRCWGPVPAAAVDDSPVLLYPHVNLAKGDNRGVPGVVIRYAEDRERQATRRDAEPRPTRSTRRRRRRGQPQLPAEVADAVADQEAVDPIVYLVRQLNQVDRGGTVKRGNALRSKIAAPSGRDIEAIILAMEAGWVPGRGDLAARFRQETLGQALNPHAGKGTNRPKPTGPKKENLKAPAIEEWLKYGGLYSHAYARRVSAREGSADIEILVPVPTDISVDAARGVMAQLRNVRIGGQSIKFEILAVLSYSGILVRHHRANFADALYRRRRVNRIVSSIEVAYFQDLGGNKVVTGLYALALPGWFDLDRAEDVETYLTLLKEHQDRIDELEEGRRDRERLRRRESAPMSLFLGYRRFLSEGDLRSFALFLLEHGGFVMRSWAAGDEHKPERFGVEGIERIVGGNGTMRLSEVIKNEGFRNVARAIRRSTIGEVVQQSERYKSRMGGVRYDVRYGLGQELKRRARKAEEFLGAVAAFAQSYNWENSRVREQFDKQGRELPAHRRRFDISDFDLDAVVRLIEEAEDPETVALLLVAYGFAKAEREGAESNTGIETS